MTTTYEIVSKFESEGDAQSLLYAPPATLVRFRKTMRYTFDYEGDAAALNAFVNEVLVDRISQESHQDAAPLFSGTEFILDYGMKGAALDLEKEAILNYFRSLSAPAFSINKLTLRTRLYIFGEGADKEAFVRDIVNPAIQNSEFIQA